MEGQWPTYTPVKNKKLGYKGWIDGITKTKEYFTGNTDCKWQYRIITEENPNIRKIVPSEDLERITDGAEFPPIEAKNFTPGYFVESAGIRILAEETQLHALGYQITGMNYSERWEVLEKVAIPILGIEAVAGTIIAVASLRCKEKNVKKYHYTLLNWAHDLEMIFDKYGESHNLKDTRLQISFERFKQSLRDFKVIDDGA